MEKREFFVHALENAERAASEVDNPDERISAFICVAEAIAQTGQFRKAYDMIARNSTWARSYHNSPAFVEWLIQTAVELASKGRLETARQAATEIKGILNRVKAFAAIAKVSLDLRDLDAARALAAKITKTPTYKGLRVQAFAVIASASRETSDFEVAGEAASMIRSEPSRSWAYEEIVRVHLEAGDLNGARAAANQIASVRRRTDILRSIAALDQSTTDPEAALKTATEVHDLGLRTQVFFRIVQMSLMHGDSTLARKAAAETEAEPLGLIGLPPGVDFVSVLESVLPTLAEQGALRVARQFAAGLGKAFERSRAFNAIARLSRDSGDFQASRLAWTALEKDQSFSLRDIADTEAVQTLVVTGEFQAARELSERITEPSERSIAIASVAVGLAFKGDLAAARRMAAEIFKPASRAWAFAKIAGVSGESRDFEAALAAAAEVEAPRWRASSFAEIATAWGA